MNFFEVRGTSLPKPCAQSVRGNAPCRLGHRARRPVCPLGQVAARVTQTRLCRWFARVFCRRLAQGSPHLRPWSVTSLSHFLLPLSFVCLRSCFQAHPDLALVSLSQSDGFLKDETPTVGPGSTHGSPRMLCFTSPHSPGLYLFLSFCCQRLYVFTSV